MHRFLLPLVLLIAFSAPASAVDVTTDDPADAYVIAGAALIPGGFTEARDAATCSDCHWRIIPICQAGSLDDRRACIGIECPADTTIAEVWRALAPTAPPVGDPAWEYRGITCLDRAPVAAGAITTAVPDLVREAVPPLRPASQPARTALTGLPVHFMTNQPASIVRSTEVAGIPVTLHAGPHWNWDFGQGAPLATLDPGGVWPTGRLRHTYPRRGIFRIRVDANWHAVYDANGVTGIPVDGVITQSAWFDLRVREARRFLNIRQGA